MFSNLQKEIKIIIDAFEAEGIVTRNDSVLLNGRPSGKALEKELHQKGYTNARYTEAELNNYKDYSGVVYDCERYNLHEAQEYLKTYILREE